MKKILLFLSLICSTFNLSAQSVLASAGNNQIAGALQQSYTLGESFIAENVVGATVNSRGFQQPEIRGVSVCEAKNPRIPCARDIGPKPPQALKSPVSRKGHRASSFAEGKVLNTVPGW